MKDIVVIGGGKIGSVIAEMLADSGDYAVKVVDRAAEALALLPKHAKVSGVVADVADPAALDAVL